MTLENEADSYVRNTGNLLLSNDTSHPKSPQSKSIIRNSDVMLTQ